MTEDYCKLVSGIILSTIWRKDDHTRILWITMLAVKDRHHRVMASVPGLAAVANLPVDSVRASIEKLMAPDPDSRTKDHEGRRIAAIDGGWLVLNGEKYRNFLSKAERNEYQAKLMSDRRAKQKSSRVSTMLAPVSTELALLAHTEAEADTEAEAEATVPPTPLTPGTPTLNLDVPALPPPAASTKRDPPVKDLPEKLNTARMQNKWQVWQTMRRGKGKVKSWPLLFNEQIDWLDRFDEPTAFEILSASIRNGWTGLFEPKETNHGKTSGEINKRNQFCAVNPENDYGAAFKRKVAKQDAEYAQRELEKEMAEKLRCVAPETQEAGD
jgi:hypothetical protein